MTGGVNPKLESRVKKGASAIRKGIVSIETKIPLQT